MDYNDNDYESQNLHLAGEESSKISSVLRPFALPKFEFDDSIPGHLRFDSLVENEVFLGISSQEDNQWIEEFSRAGNGIEFSSSAAESCALPRHINVWSEATSSESVEMLLKAVGQEEMVLGENMTEKSDQRDELGNSTRQPENNLEQEYRGDDADIGNPSPPAEVEGNLSMNQNAQVEGVHTEYTLQAEETKFSYGVCVDSKGGSLTVATEITNTEMNKISDYQGETCGLVDESLSNQVEESLPVLGTEIDNTESSSQNIAVTDRECVDTDRNSDIDFITSSRTSKGISDSVEEQKEGFYNDGTMSEIAVETRNTEGHHPEGIPSRLESLEGEHTVEIHVTEVEKASSVPNVGEFVSTDDGCNEIASAVKPVGGSQHGTTEIKQVSEDCNILLEKASSSLQGEGIEGLQIKGSDVVTTTSYDNTDLEKVPVIQPSDPHKNTVGNEDICPGSNISPEASHSTSKPSLTEVLSNFSDKDGQNNVDHADGPRNLIDSKFSGEYPGHKSAIDNINEARDTAAMQKESVQHEDHVPSSLIAGSRQTCMEDIISMQVDTQESDLDVSAYEKEDQKLPLNSSMVCDEIEKVVSTLPGEGVKIGTSTGSQPNSSAGDCPVLNTEEEDTKFISSRAEGDKLADTGHKDQSNEIESDAPNPSTSVSKESLESNALAQATETDRGTQLDSAAGETQRNDGCASLVETSSVATPDEACTVINKKMERPNDDSTVVDDGAEAGPTEKPMEVETKGHPGTDPTLSVTSCTQSDQSDQAAVPSTSLADLLQNDMSKHASVKTNNIANKGEVTATSEISGGNVPSKEEGTFTFDVRPVAGQSTEDSGKGLQSFPRIQACKLSLTGEGSPSASVSSQTDLMSVKEIHHAGSLTPVVSPPSGGLRGAPERKARRGSSKSGKGSAKRGNQVKETTPLRQTEGVDKSSPFLSPLGASQFMTVESVVKPVGAVSIPTSSLPDLNTSASSSAFFQQPFTDLQQVQLRAQIFVYGSLIQGAAPDEACMASAFDGGRSVWESSWRACVERLHGQKSQGANTGTPLPTRSDAGGKPPDQIKRQGFRQSEALSSMSGRASSKAIPSPINPMSPLSSPLWSIPTPSGEALPPSSVARSGVIDYQAVSPLNPYHTPPTRNFIAHTTWPSQGPFPVPWRASSQSSPFDISTSFPAFPITEPVKLTSVKEQSMPTTSSTRHSSPLPASHTGATTMFAGVSSHDSRKVKASTAGTKTRKRKKSSAAEDVVQISVTASLADVSAPVVATQLPKKAPAFEDPSQISLITWNQADSMPAPVVTSHYSTSDAVTTPPSFTLKGTTNQFLSVVPPSMSSDHLKRSDLAMDKRAQNIEGKVEEAKLEAQEAAAHAAATVSHCEGVWSQLVHQKSSGLTSDAESKLASFAASIAAAASVAKAAAAAAKIASSAAVQAKQMYDEAVASSGTVNTTEYGAVLVSNSMSSVNASPVSILQGGDQNNAPSSAISAAREAARKRIEAASAATRHAENLDAIVKAAELAEEAVSHAGKIVAMGDPFSLTELAEAGPNNYWKVSQDTTMPGSKPNDMNKNKSTSSNAGEALDAYINENEGSGKDMPGNMVDDHMTVDQNVVSDQALDLRSNSSAGIKEGSHVEVLRDRGGLKKAWFPASVLSLKDGEALVCYNELQSGEGSENLKEWVAIEAKDGEAPKVRIPHPMNAVQFEGTRKRRRSAVKDYTWSVGDKVDAWVNNCWCEGHISEKTMKDATTMSVHFPDQGETLMVKIWHLRPSLIWIDGQWIEWRRPGKDSTSQGDTPVEKRTKLGSISVETKGKAKVAKNIDFVETGRNDDPKLPLSANEKVFNIGSMREENKPNTVRAMRSGLEKGGGSRGVVFGIPKPGKKRKFMEVSKHYVSDRSTKANVPNDSVKLSKFLTPQGSVSRGFRSNSKPDLKDKQVAESKPRALKSGKPPSIPSRTLARKDDSTTPRPNARNATVSDHILKGFTSNDENESGDQSLAEFRSVPNEEETSGGTMVFSSQALPLENRKKVTARNTKSERHNQGKLAPAGGKSAKVETNEKLVSEVSEPRRSNRRIQPTSRLLEGLQSSLIISKIPSSSHDKSQRSQNKGGTSRGNSRRG